MTLSARRALGAALLICLGATGEAGASDATSHPPRCSVEVDVQPEHARVGQQLIYNLRILRRLDVSELSWERPLSFPTFRAEWLPGRAADRTVEHAGESYRAYSERRALFPVHAGRLQLPGAAIRCTAPDGEEIVAVPARNLEVAALPEAGRPEDFQGVVGRVQLSVTAAPEAIALGESVRLSVVARGTGNLWSARPLLVPEPADSEIEVFPLPATSARDAGRALSVRRYFAYDLVPQHAGVFRLPDAEMAFFDPETGRYEVARAAGRHVSVAPARARAPAPPADARAPEPTPAVRLGMPRMTWLLASAGAALCAALLVAGWLRHRSGHDRWSDVARLADAARNGATPEERDHAAGSALRAALSRSFPQASALSVEELVAHTPDSGGARDAAELLGRIESGRFGAATDAAWSIEELEGSLAALRGC